MREHSEHKQPRKQQVLRRDYAIGTGIESGLPEKAKNMPEWLRATGAQERQAFRKIYEVLPDDHDTVQELKSMLVELAKVFDMDMTDVKVAIYESFDINAHVSFLAKDIAVSRSLINLLESDWQAVQSIIAHEIGHVVLKHEADEPTGSVLDEIDPLRDKISRYEEEYQADRASIIAQHRLGQDTSALRKSLERIDTFINEQGIGHMSLENNLAWIVRSHPHTSRRAIALRRLERYLPYEHSGQHKKISRISEKDFKQTPRGESRLLLPPALQQIDILWEEMDRGVFFNHEFVAASEDKLQNLPTSYQTSYDPIFEPMDYLPDDVNALEAKDQRDIHEWWDQTMNMIAIRDGLLDLRDDVMQYDLEKAKLLLTSVDPRAFLDVLVPRKPDEQHNSSDMFALVLGGEETEYLDVRLRLVASLLVKNIFEKDPTMKTADGLRSFLQLERDFRVQTGFYLPYDQGRLFLLAENLFSVADEGEKRVLVELLDEFGAELGRGSCAVTDGLSKKFLAPVFAWLETNDSVEVTSPLLAQNRLFRKRNKLGRKEEEDDDEDEDEEQKPQATEQNEIDRLKQVLHEEAKNHTHSSWTESVTKVSIQLWSEFRKSKKGQPSAADRFREVDPTVSVNIYSSDEFEEMYFGEGRNAYIKSSYTTLEEKRYSRLIEMWRKAGYESDLTQQKTSSAKLEWIVSTFPFHCASRDQLITKSLGITDLAYTEEIMDAKKYLDTVTDLPLLFQLRESFAHPLLRLACARRLWELYETNPEGFAASLSTEEKTRVQELIAFLPDSLKTARLQAILLCHNSPSFLRDELLRAYIDAAPSEAITLQLAGLLSEPPPGVIAKRQGEFVSASESILDGMRAMSATDKMEALLYLLGQRNFYSGIDELFVGTMTGKGDEKRRNVMFNSLERPKDDIDNFFGDSGHMLDDDELNPKYMVDRPDALVYLSKFSGIPLDLMLEQERMLSTRREEMDLLSYILVGPNGALFDLDKDRFLTSVARVLVEHTSFKERLGAEDKAAMSDLLSFALQNCPQEKIPQLFLNLWYISQEKGASLPQLTASLFREYGPVFVKAGQYLATQTASLPKAWTQAFRGLSDKNIAAEKTLLYEYEYSAYKGQSPFNRLGSKAGEGSMAAVYEGNLEDGKEVVAKVQHPFIRKEIEGDIDFLAKLVGFVNDNSSRYGGIKLPDNLAEVTRGHMREELDFAREGKNAKSLGKIISKELLGVRFSVPQPIEKHSRDGFLVLEKANGVSVDADEKLQALGINPEQVRAATALEILRQVVAHGTYQADANLGNFGVEKNLDGKPLVHFYDTGHVGRLNKKDRTLLKSFLREMTAQPSSSVVADAFSQMIEVPKGSDRSKLRNMIESWALVHSPEISGGLQNVQALFTSLLDYFSEKKLVFKEQWVVLLRTVGLLQPLLADVKPEQVFEVLGPYIMQSE